MAYQGRCLAVVWAFGMAVGIAQAAVNHDSALAWQTLRGKHFLVHYHDGADAQAREVLAIAERVHARLTPLFRWEPAAPTEIVVSDEFDISNGSATPFPANRITLWLAPPDDINTLEAHAGWIEMVLQHEYTHILHLDKTAGVPRVVREFLGRAPLLFPSVFPNAFQPSWLIEGLAVYHETDRARGIGRGHSSLFDMYMRMEVAGGMKPLRQINQEVDTWPAGAVPYLYGVQFYNHIAARHGVDAITRWVDNYSENLVPYRILSNTKQTVGKPLDTVWQEFERDRTEHYRAQLAAIDARGVHAGERLTHNGYQASQTRALADGTILYMAFDGRSHPALMLLRPGETVPRTLAEVNPYARLDVHPTAGALVAQPERCRNARVVYDLYRVDIATGRVTRLTHCARYRQAVWHPDGARIAAVHHRLGRSRLDALDADGRFVETLWQGTGDEVVGDLDWSADGERIVAAVWRRESGWNLEMFSLGERRWRMLTHAGAIAMQPRFARDGNSVLFSSDHGGVYNLRRVDLASGRVTTLTNVAGGAFYPAQTADGTLYYIGYSPSGFDLYRVRPGVFATPAAPVYAGRVPEPLAPSAAVTADVERYSPWRGLRPTWWVPHLVVETGRTEIGAITLGTDALYRHLYAIDAAYDFSVHSFVGRVDYIYDRWWPVMKLHALRENDFTRDNDDEVTRVRHSDNYIAEVVLPWLTLDTRFSLHAGAAVEKDTDAVRLRGAAALPSTNDSLLGIAAIWDTTNRYPLSVSRSDGRELRLVVEDNDALGGDFSGKKYTLDWREFIALGNEHVLALRFAEGWGSDRPRPFELGGTRGAAQAPPVLAAASFDTPFNVRRYPLRGYPDGRASLTGRRIQVGTIEWRFPIRRVERGIMAPPLALHQLAGAVFVDSGGVWDDGRSPEHRRTGVGVELHADSAALYSLRFNLRLGFAHGFDEDGKNQAYLRIGSSF